MPNVKKRLAELGVDLPECPTPAAAYIPACQAGDLIFVSGNTAWQDGVLLYPGRVGAEVSLEDAYRSARLSAIRCLSALASVADLDQVRIVQVSGYVYADAAFKDHPKVINGASELIEAVFGDRGRHARKAVGCGGLPDNASVEVELTALLCGK